MPGKPIEPGKRSHVIPLGAFCATIKPPWKSGTALAPIFRLAVHAVTPSLVIAATVPSFWNANTSATPLELGTAGTIRATPDPFPGFDHNTVPNGRLVDTVTSADPVPALIVAFPSPTAVRTGGSSVDNVTTVGSLVVQASPVTGWLDEFSARSEFSVSPKTILMMLGTTVCTLPGAPNDFELLHTPFT